MLIHFQCLGYPHVSHLSLIGGSGPSDCGWKSTPGKSSLSCQATSNYAALTKKAWETLRSPIKYLDEIATRFKNSHTAIAGEGLIFKQVWVGLNGLYQQIWLAADKHRCLLDMML